MTEVDRRTALAAACAGCAGLALTACGGGSGRTQTPPVSAATASPAAPAASPAAAAAPLVRLSALAVGASASARGPGGARLLVTRTGAATAVAFSAVCTHQGCTVEPGRGALACPCHGSTYDATTGAVLHGPAPRPLEQVHVVVRDGGVYPA